MTTCFAIAAVLFVAASVLAPSAREISVALYARVSTADQHCDMQLTELRAHAARMGWKIVEEYIEHASGKAGARRPQQQRLMKDAAHHKFDVVMVYRLDRFGRSVSELSRNILQLDSHGIRFLAPSQGLDTDQRNPMARLLINVLSAFAEFERDIIAERVTSGLREYQQAYRLGKVGKDKLRRSRSGEDKPVGRPRCIFRRDVAAEMRKQGRSWRDLAREFDVSVRTIRREFKKAA